MLHRGKIAFVALLVCCTAPLFSGTHTEAAGRSVSQTTQLKKAPHTSALTADEGTNRGGLSRDGWYPEASQLTPSNVVNGRFGLLLSVPITGQVYAQPVMDGSNAIVATEQNWVYGINQVTGARDWAVQVGANVGAQPFNDVSPTVSTIAPWDCNDLNPYIGITSTPVIDPTTGVIYVVAMEQLSDGSLGYFMHALNPTNGKEEPDFPVEIEGATQNNPKIIFNAYYEIQRVALTLTNGVIYFGFSSHCDRGYYQGYVAGVSESGHLAALWTDVVSGASKGGGIWQAGGGFASDETGQIIVAAGNGLPGTSPSGTIPGKSPPTTGELGESDIRLVAQSNGSLKASDFFTPYDALTLDQDDLDFGSGAPVLLPSQFGTAAVPDLLVQTGKEGYVYLLNAKNLGGVSPGDAGALAEQGPDGAAWTTPGVWPGDGGYIYIPTADGGTKSLGNASQGDLNVLQVKKPSASSSSFGLVLVAKGPEAVGFGTSSPIVTSDGTTSGSAIVWIIQLQNGGGASAQLQAYNAVPSAGSGANPGSLTLIGQWPVNGATRFAPPGVGDNRLFVPTNNNQLLIYGLSASTVFAGHGTNFRPTTVGKIKAMTLSFVAQSSFTISADASGCGLCTRTTQFAVVAASPKFVNGELSVNAGQSFTVTATFKPTGVSGYRSDALRIVTSLGEVDFTLDGTARAATAWVTPSTLGLTLPGYDVGQSHRSVSTITYTNFGSKRATIIGYISTLKPFVVSGLPKVGSSLAPGASFNVRVAFSSRIPGSFHRTFDIKTNSPTAVADSVVNLNAVASEAPVFSVEPSSLALTFGTTATPVPVGTPLFRSVTVSNPGGSILTLASATVSGPYVLVNPPAHEQLLAGASLTLHLLYMPRTAGAVDGSLVIKPVGLPAKRIALTAFGGGTGYAISPPGSAGWQYAGNESMLGPTLVLTPNEEHQSGSAFTQTPVTSGSFVANFTASAVGGTGGDEEAFILADSSNLGGTFPLVPLGGSNGEVGFGGTVGIAVVISEALLPGTASDRWVGIADGLNKNTGAFSFIEPPVNLNVSTQDSPNDVTVSLENSTIHVWVDGVEEIDESVSAPTSFLMGFSAGTGFLTNIHEVAGVSIIVGGGTPSKILKPR